MDIFKELTFKETSTTTRNFRRKDFNYILGILEFLRMYIYFSQSQESVFNTWLLDSLTLCVILLCIYFVFRFSFYPRPYKMHSF